MCVDKNQYGSNTSIITIITGTGRTGTSYLIALLSYLSLPTGYCDKAVQCFLDIGVSGFERITYSEILPYINGAKQASNSDLYTSGVKIFKAPDLILSHHLKNFTKMLSVYWAHELIIPMRSSVAVALSRFKNQLNNISQGGLHANVSTVEDEKRLNDHNFNKMVQSFVKHEFNFKFLWYPKYIQSPQYLHRTLKDFFDRYGVSLLQLKAGMDYMKNQRCGTMGKKCRKNLAAEAEYSLAYYR